MTPRAAASDTDGQATVALGQTVQPARPAASQRRQRRSVGVSLKVKIFAAVLVLVVFILGSVLAVIQVKAAQVTRRAVDARMATVAASFTAFVGDERASALAAVRQLADDPNTVAAITTQDPATALDYLRQKNDEVLHAEYLMALDDEGYVLARSDDPAAAGELLGHVSPLFAEPLDGRPATGFSELSGRLGLLAAAPVVEGGARVVGVLVVAARVGDELAARAQEVTQADASFVALAEGGPQLAATTLGRTAAQALVDRVAARSDLTMAATNSGHIGPLELDLDGDPNVVVIVPLQAAGGETRGLFVASRSLGREMAVYGEIQRTVIVFGLAAVLLALALSLFLAGRITRPIQALVEVAERVKDGDLDVPIPAAGDDEIGLLAEAFARMVVELRQKEELEQYLQSLTQAMDGGGTVTPTAAATQVALRTVAGSAVAAAGPQPGGLFADRYDIVKVLGAGGMGKVYLARDRDLGEAVAIKTILGQAALADPSVLERFKQEIRLARRVANKHVLRTYHFGEAGGVHYLTMEYFQGVTLKHLLKGKGPFPLGPGLLLARQICDGLGAAHEQGVVHRDVKPHNMLVSPRGELKLMDFGISRLVDSAGMTQTGTVLGTPDYMSPEQAKGLAADERSDLYAVGVVLFEMFTGTLPFTAPEPLAVVLKHVQEPPPSPRQYAPTMPVELEAVILAAMAKDPGARPASMAELRGALERITS